MPEFWTVPKIRGLANEILIGQKVYLTLEDCEEITEWIIQLIIELTNYRDLFAGHKARLRAEALGLAMREAFQDGLHEEPGD